MLRTVQLHVGPALQRCTLPHWRRLQGRRAARRWSLMRSVHARVRSRGCWGAKEACTAWEGSGPRAGRSWAHCSPGAIAVQHTVLRTTDGEPCVWSMREVMSARALAVASPCPPNSHLHTAWSRSSGSKGVRPRQPSSLCCSRSAGHSGRLAPPAPAPPAAWCHSSELPAQLPGAPMACSL